MKSELKKKADEKVPSSGTELGTRIFAICSRFGWDKSAEVANKSVMQMKRYAKGDDPPFSVLSRLNHHFEIDFDWLVTGEGEMFRTEAPPAVTPAPVLGASGDDFVLVPQLDVEASAGGGAVIDSEAVSGYLAFRQDWIHKVLYCKPSDLVVIAARGDSMEPTVRSGDALLVQTGINTFIDEAIYVLTVNETVLVKRVQVFMNGSVCIKSDNPAYKEQTLSAEDAAQVNIAGIVRWIGRLC